MGSQVAGESPAPGFRSTKQPSAGDSSVAPCPQHCLVCWDRCRVQEDRAEARISLPGWGHAAVGASPMGSTPSTAHSAISECHGKRFTGLESAGSLGTGQTDRQTAPNSPGAWLPLARPGRSWH